MDQKILSFLKKYYGGSNTYAIKDIPNEVVEYCIEKGVMFKPSEITHDEAVKQVKLLCEQITLEEVANAFLYSLSTGDKIYRTALSSYLFGRQLQQHQCIATIKNGYTFEHICGICGFKGVYGQMLTNNEPIQVEWNSINGQRLFPGWSNDMGCLEYVLLDLREFIKLPKVTPKEEDYTILREILAQVYHLNPANKASALVTQVKKANVIKATTDEIHAILGILSMCSILQTPKHVGYLETLPLNHLRVFSGDNDHYYPLVFWRGKDGINDQAVKAIFGESADKHLNPELIKLTVSKLEYELEKNSHKRKKSKGEQYFKPNQYVITLTEEERKYLGLEPMLKTYEAETTYSSTNLVHKRTTLIYNGDTIVKVISEERKITSDSAYDHTMYIEYDTYLKTDNRQWLLPLTKRGKKKSITPSSVTSITSKKCVFNIQIREKHSSIHICNTYNQQDINLFDLDEEIRQIQTEEEFHDFMEKYKTTCPTYYFDRIEEMKNMPAQTVKFKEGDIFRCEYGRNQYYYGLIIGKVRKIEKWKELPSKHSFRNLMGQPIMIRMYDLTTTRKDMTAEELSFIPLMPVKICDDWDIIRGRHPIVGHKVLEPSDIEFKFICTQITSENKHKTLFTDQILKGIFLENKNKEYKLYIEWGFAQTEILYNQLTDELKVYMATDSSYEGGVSLGINNLFLKQDENKLKMIFRCLGISEETTFDEFAKLYGGITRALYISLI